MGGNTWLASMLDEMPLGKSESNIKGLNPAPGPAPAPAELKASDEGTGFLTAELLRRAHGLDAPFLFKSYITPAMVGCIVGDS
jgi:hypothetical protein